MKSLAPIVTEKRAPCNSSRVAETPMLEIMSCLVFAKLSNCASKLIRPPYELQTNCPLLVYCDVKNPSGFKGLGPVGGLLQAKP